MGGRGLPPLRFFLEVGGRYPLPPGIGRLYIACTLLPLPLESTGENPVLCYGRKIVGQGVTLTFFNQGPPHPPSGFFGCGGLPPSRGGFLNKNQMNRQSIIF